jgi:hypothetical protein
MEQCTLCCGRMAGLSIRTLVRPDSVYSWCMRFRSMTMERSPARVPLVLLYKIWKALTCVLADPDRQE